MKLALRAFAWMGLIVSVVIFAPLLMVILGGSKQSASPPSHAPKNIMDASALMYISPKEAVAKLGNPNACHTDKYGRTCKFGTTGQTVELFFVKGESLSVTTDTLDLPFEETSFRSVGVPFLNNMFSNEHVIRGTFSVDGRMVEANMFPADQKIGYVYLKDINLFRS